MCGREVSLATVTTKAADTTLFIILLEANNISHAQDKAKYPKPDFSAIEEWYEITKVEYYIFDQVLSYVVKPKVESRPKVFELRFVDEDGAIISET